MRTHRVYLLYTHSLCNYYKRWVIGYLSYRLPSASHRHQAIMPQIVYSETATENTICIHINKISCKELQSNNSAQHVQYYSNNIFFGSPSMVVCSWSLAGNSFKRIHLIVPWASITKYADLPSQHLPFAYKEYIVSALFQLIKHCFQLHFLVLNFGHKGIFKKCEKNKNVWNWVIKMDLFLFDMMALAKDHASVFNIS